MSDNATPDDAESGTGDMASGDRHESRSDMERAVAEKEQRRLRSRQMGARSAWFGLGMFGVIGWSVAVPMVAGIAIGLWVDSKFESQRSWTLMLMVLGLGFGCVNAWSWIHRESVMREQTDIQERNEENEDQAGTK
ncbi:MAG: ATP synthase protein I [Planctomycetaceae bacterium]|mgnify:CR=1 FL=1|jgi:ATP synthase protein I